MNGPLGFTPQSLAEEAVQAQAKLAAGLDTLREVEDIDYGATRREAVANVEALALRVLAERLEHGEPVPDLAGLFAA